MKNFYSSFLGVLAFSFIVSNLTAQQTSDNEKLEEKYFDYFSLSRENVYLHLNKTALIPGEDLWLSSYVYNTTTELPNQETTNLRVDIYDEQGQHYRSHTVHVIGGKGSTMLPLNPKQYPPGTYYLKASTRYMKNFPEDLSYLQPFTILGDKGKARDREIVYDLQLLPEGGHLVTGNVNSIGVKMIDQDGFGAAFSEGIVLDGAGNEITRFDSNRFGMSRFYFTPLPQVEYFARVTTVDGKEVRQKIPRARETGINMVATQRDKHFQISLRTNKTTHKQVQNKPFLVKVHKDGKLRDFRFSFPEDELEVNILLNKDSLFPGTNTVTIFDDRLNPLLERVIFNEKTLKRQTLKTSFTDKGNDSISLNFESPTQSALSLSVSVLPKDTQSFDPVHNILSAFYLRPHLKGAIDEGGYYFSPGDENRKLYDLDLLLLTQGWSRYDWSDIEKNVINELQKHEVGFTVTGKLKKGKEKNQNTLFIGSEDLFEMTQVMEDGSFSLKNSFLSDSTELAFGLVNDKTSKLTKPTLTVRVTPEKEAEKHGEPLKTSREFYYSADDGLPRAYSRDLDGLETLDTVVVDAKRHVFVPEFQIYDRGIEITEEIANQYHHIADFIATKGFKVQYVQGQLEIRSFIISTFGGAMRKPSEYRTAQSNVMIYFNGVPVGTDTSFLNGMPTSQVESIVINKRGVGYGGQGVNGVIHINAKQGALIRDTTERILTVIANNGYTPNKEFYTPRYAVRNTAAYNRFAAVDWIPNLIFDSEGKASIALEKDQSFRLFVQGMGADGSLVSEELVVEKNP